MQEVKPVVVRLFCVHIC